ncbi:MAG: ion transporter [Thermoanaerobaculales bacterium]|nr:ion transporter [Thermoanaerobaculales bacterium]
MPSFRAWRAKYGRLTLRSLWDLFMVWVVFINLCLILFDLSYPWLRPTYFRYLPPVTRIWDPVLGIEPHPLTGELREKADVAARLLELDPSSAALETTLGELRSLTRRVFVENPFERSGQDAALGAIKEVMARETGHAASQLRNPEVLAAIARDFWSGPPELLRHRFALYEQQIEPRLAVNYFRGHDLDGHLIDHFWKIDLPFLVLFWIEFFARWGLAIHSRRYARWYFFPIFYWYDLLSLIPVTALRPLRLLRVVSIYMRLRKSELSRVGKDFVSRSVAYISNIITEEVSDRVAVRILTEFGEEIGDGTHVRIARATVEPRRVEIERVLVRQIRAILCNEETVARFRRLLELNLENAVEESASLRALPLPHVVVKPVVRAVGEVLLDTTLETITATVDSPEGEEALQAVAASVLDELLTGPALAELETLAREISLQVISQMKDVVTVRKWSLPDEQTKRTPMPWENEEPDSKS